MQPTAQFDSSGDRTPSVAILLCTMQGHQYLREQLQSIMTQTHESWSIWVSDDGSDSDTHAILDEYQDKLGATRLSVLFGPAKGFAANFLSLTCNASIAADYYAYADQDDIWESDKLAQALHWLQTVPSHVPALYCARTRKVDANNRDIGFSKLFTRPPSFTNAMVQNIGSGNTMVFNHAACVLLRTVGADLQVAAHDWWCYLVVSGCGGLVFYDPHPTVRYRQHDANLIGTNSNWAARLIHARMLLRGRFRDWNTMNIMALQAMREHLTAENQRRLDEFSKSRDGGLFPRLAALKRSGVYRQTLLGNLGILAAIVLKKM